MVCTPLAARYFRAKTAIVAIGLAFALWATPTPAAAHDSEHTRVYVAFHRDGTFVIDVLGDPRWFYDRLERLTGMPLSGPLEGADRDRRITELERIMGYWVWAFFDGRRLEIQPEYIPASGPPPNPDWPALATMRFRGTVPDSAIDFSFAYGLVQDDYPLYLDGNDGKPVIRWVKGDLESEQFPVADVTPPGRWSIVADYLELGFLHVLPQAADQILFVVGIFLLSAASGPLVAQVSTTLVAQTLTLGLAMFGIISLRPAIVGPMIALSVAYVAAENLFTSELKPWRLQLVFAFGLLQGIAFATALTRLGLPTTERTAATLAFNIGVVGGQLAVVAALIATLGTVRNREWYRRRAVVPLSLAIAAMGAYWTVTRITGG